MTAPLVMTVVSVSVAIAFFRVGLERVLWVLAEVTVKLLRCLVLVELARRC